MYLLIFTCLSIRAVHLELVEDMTTKSFVQAFVRFTNIYGIPSSIYSDNARPFVSGCDLLGDVMASSEFNDRFRACSIRHIRIPVHAPWVGSTWERHIKTIKMCLHKIFGRAKTNYFDLLTAFSDIQNAINSRPLTYRCSEETDLEIITPKNFLNPNANEGVIIQAEESELLLGDPIGREEILKSLEIKQAILDKFRTLYYQEYLLSLNEQCKDIYETEFVNKIKVDDVVLIKVPNKSRPHWVLGRVIELYPGEDGKVRFVKVIRGHDHVQTQAISNLYPLELTLTHCYFPKKKCDSHKDTHYTRSKPPKKVESCATPLKKLPPRRTRGRRKVDKNDPYLYYD